MAGCSPCIVVTRSAYSQVWPMLLVVPIVGSFVAR